MPTATYYVDKDATGLKGIVNNGADNAWSGSDNHLPIGQWVNDFPAPDETYRTRSLVHFNIPFASTWVSITSAVMHMKQRPRAAGSNRHGNPNAGTALQVNVRRMVRDWREGDNNGEFLFTTQDGIGYERKCQQTSPSGDANWVTGGGVDYAFTQSDDNVEQIDITAIAQAWLANFKGSRSDAPNYGVIFINGDETNENKAFDFFARESTANKPYIVITYTTATAPAPPGGEESPNGVITSPTASESLETLIPTITWTYSDPGALPQESARIRIINPSNSNILYDYRQTGTSLQHDIPGGILANSRTYQVEVKVRNTALVADPTPPVTTFSIALIGQNDSPTNLRASANEATGAIELVWDAPAIASGHTFARYNIWRKRSADTDWQVLNVLETYANPSYMDWWAGQGIQYDYRVVIVTSVVDP